MQEEDLTGTLTTMTHLTWPHCETGSLLIAGAQCSTRVLNMMRAHFFYLQFEFLPKVDHLHMPLMWCSNFVPKVCVFPVFLEIK